MTLVALATGVGEEVAAEALAAADGDLRTAIVLQAAGVDATRARAALAERGQRVRDALAALAGAADGAPAGR